MFRRFLMLVRHLIAIVILPVGVAVLVPRWIARRDGIAFTIGDSVGALAMQLGGAVLAGIGLALFLATLHLFISEGRGTLAPWDPPRALVVSGPYRIVRNPMISGVIFAVFGEAMLLRSKPIAWWGATFVVANLIYIPLLEEPMLRLRFGAAYREYCARVPRFLPRLFRSNAAP